MKENARAQGGKKIKRACPCCGHRTLGELAAYEVCPICYWEDDGQSDEDADEVRGGPNGDLSLSQARVNFKQFGASSKEHLKHVREPNEDELF